MKPSEMVEEVQVIIQDSSFSESKIVEYLNNALQRVSAQCQLPELKKIEVISTVPGQQYVTLQNFGGELSRVYTSGTNSRRIAILSGVEELFDLYGLEAKTGDVEACALEGSILWIAPVPESAMQLVLLWRNIETIDTLLDIEPQSIPPFSHRILVNTAAWMLFNLIEDGVDGEKTNTLVYKNLAEQGLIELKNWLGKNKKHKIYGKWWPE